MKLDKELKQNPGTINCTGVDYNAEEENAGLRFLRCLQLIDWNKKKKFK
jgi:hypothetical protein